VSAAVRTKKEGHQHDQLRTFSKTGLDGYNKHKPLGRGGIRMSRTFEPVERHEVIGLAVLVRAGSLKVSKSSQSSIPIGTM
jgi:hypothetical protein